MNRLTVLFYKNSYVLWLSIFVIMTAGLGAFLTMPKTEDPRITNRYANVTTSYPGATPQNVEALVTEPIENELRKAPEIKKISSTSAPGFSFIYLELKDSVTNPDPIFSKLRDYIKDAQLPQEAKPPILDETRSYGFTEIIAIQFKTLDEKKWLLAGRYANELLNRLRASKGTEKVELFAEPYEEIAISIEPKTLAQLGMTMTTIANKIASFDSKLAAGSLNSQHHRYILSVSGGFDTVQRLRELPILEQDKKVLLLKDIAQIHATPQKPINSFALANGKQAILIGVRMLPDQNINQWTADIHTLIDSFRQQIPPSINIETIFSQKIYTNARFYNLGLNMVQGLLSIILVLMITLGIRGALIVSIALPLTVLTTAYLLKVSDFSLHQITVIGLIVALGIMIDNAIVIAESIESKRLAGVAALKAVRYTVSHFWLSLMGATLTTILTFLPIILLEGPTGEFVEGIGYSVIYTLICSYIISHTIIAALSGRYMPTNQANQWWQKGISLPSANRLFHVMLGRMLDYPKQFTALLLILASIGFIAQFGLIEEFFPASDRNQISLILEGTPAKDLQQTLKQVAAVNEQLSKESNIESIAWQLGESFPSYYYNILMLKKNLPNFAQAMITVKKDINKRAFINQLQTILDRQFPEVKIQVRKISQGPPVEAIEIHIYGHNLNLLHQLGDQVRARLQDIDPVIHTNASLDTGLPKITLTLNEQQAAQLNLSSRKFANEINAFIDGIEAGFVQQGSEQIPIRVRLQQKYRQDLSDILELPISFINADQQYQATPIAAIAKAKVEPEWFSVSRLNNRRVNTISATIQADKLPEAVLKQFRQSLREHPIKLPPDYQIVFGGEKEERDESVQNLMASLPLISTLMIAVLVLTFQSLLLVAIIIIIITAVSMGLLSLFLSGYPFGFQVLISLFGLVGLSINAAIIILSEIQTLSTKKKQEKQAIIDAVEICLRHITSTTLTTIAGFSPFLIANDLFWTPFAWTIAGGTLLTTLLSIFLVPLLFYTLSGRRQTTT